jgi:positive regulator of sigma E activity
MSEYTKKILTEIFMGLWISTGLAAHFATVILFLQIIFYFLSCISVGFIIVLNYDKVLAKLNKKNWFIRIKKIIGK